MTMQRRGRGFANPSDLPPIPNRLDNHGDDLNRSVVEERRANRGLDWIIPIDYLIRNELTTPRVHLIM